MPDILNIDFISLLPHAIEVFSHIYGEEYRDIIKERINRAFILPYLDPEAIYTYATFLQECKQKEFAVEFLNRIGIDTTKYSKENYTEALDSEVTEILFPYINSPHIGMDKKNANYWSPIRAFDPNNIDLGNPYHEKSLLQNRVILVNYLRKDKEKLTKESFPSFTETEEYRELLKKINELKTVHDELLSKYAEWEKCLIPYKEYVSSEKNRKEEILQKKMDELFEEIFPDIPVSIKTKMEGKTLKEKQEMFFMTSDISSPFKVEFFSKEEIDNLSSESLPLRDKSWIVIYQRLYLKGLRIEVPNMSTYELETEEGIKKHLEFLNQEYLKTYIPEEKALINLTDLREKKYEEGIKEYHTTRKDFRKILEQFNNSEVASDFIYKQIKGKNVCITINGGKRSGNFGSIMFYTPNSKGHLFASFLHEIEHIIDQPIEGCCGFETAETFYEDAKKNSYDENFRKYEKFNETITDIFKIEAVDFFQNQGIYHIEPKEFVLLDISNHNTSVVTKNLLKPLLQKFRPEIIKAKTNSNQEELTTYIGEDNFEALVDSINKVDYLSRNGLIPKIEKSPYDPMVIEYKQELKRVEEIYINIDSYYSEVIQNIDKKR